MADFDLQTFANRLREELQNHFPYGTGRPLSKMKKAHMRDLGFSCNFNIQLTPNSLYFEFGNEQAERFTPHYHILEDAQVIHKPYRGTKKSRGSQQFVDPSFRDYNIQKAVLKNGSLKVSRYTEYRKNVDGKRSLVSKAQRRYGKNGKVITENANAPYYVNTHYHYIEDTLDTLVVPRLANEFGLTKVSQVEHYGFSDNVMEGDKFITPLGLLETSLGGNKDD